MAIPFLNNTSFSAAVTVATTLTVGGTGSFTGNVGIGIAPQGSRKLSIQNTNADNEIEFYGTDFTNIYSRTDSGMTVEVIGNGFAKLATTGGNLVISSAGVGTFSAVPVVGTRSAGDNTTRAASTAFVTTAVATGVGAYLPLVGGTMTGNINMGDNDVIGIDELKFSSGTKLSDANNNNYMRLTYDSAGAGGLEIFDGGGLRQGYLYSNGGATSEFGLLTGAGQWAVRTIENGLVELRHNNAARLTTTTQGIVLNTTQVYVGNDGTYSGYGVVGFGGTSNGSNRIFANVGTADGLFLASATTRGVFIRANGRATDDVEFAANGDVKFNYGQLILNGTGRIQGVDTVSASTDAANKAYVDAHGGGLGPFLPLSAGSGFPLTGDLHINSGKQLRLYRSDNATYARFDYSGSSVGLDIDDLNGDGINLQQAGVNKLRIETSGNATFAGNITTGGQITVPSGYSVNIGTSRIHSTSTSYLLGGNVGIGTTVPAVTLDVNGSTKIVGGIYSDTGGIRLLNPGGAIFTNQTPSYTGAIKITLPVGFTNTMQRMTIKVYEYGTSKSFTVNCGGYNYQTGSWINTFAYTECQSDIDTNYTVRFGKNSSNIACIYIGELADTWSYPQIFVTDWQGGYSNLAGTTWDNGWAIAFEASAFESITKTIANTQVNNWQRNGQNIYFASGSGNVGIGNTLPQYKLVVQDGDGGGTGGSGIDSRTKLLINANTEAYLTFNVPALSFTGQRYMIAGTTKASVELWDYAADPQFRIASVDSRPLTFATQNAEKMRISPGGSVKFNTYNAANNTGTPTYILGTDATGNVVKVLGGDIPGGGGTVTGTGVVNRVAFWNTTTSLTSNVDLYWDNTNDRLGIGGATPIDVLHVYGGNNTGITISSNGYVANAGSMLRFRQMNSEELAGIKGSFEQSGQGNYGNLTFLTRTSDALGLEEKMRISSAGDVGIGTTPTVGYNLDVKRTSPGYSIVGRHATGGKVGIYNSTGDNGIGTVNNYAFNLFTNNSAPQVTIDTAGNVGIGTTNPTFGLTLSRNSDPSGLNSGVLLGLESADLARSAGYRMKSEDASSTPQYYQVLFNGDNIQWKNWTGSAYAAKMTLSTAGALRLNAYGAGYLKSDASGNITAAGAGQVGPFLPLAGGTMTGTIVGPTAGSSSANPPALEVVASGTGNEQASIAIQQKTAEGDTIIFADYEPHVEWGISTENNANEIQFTAGAAAGSLGTKTLYNNAGSARTAYIKFNHTLGTGNTQIGGTLSCAGGFSAASGAFSNLTDTFFPVANVGGVLINSILYKINSSAIGLSSASHQFFANEFYSISNSLPLNLNAGLTSSVNLKGNGADVLIAKTGGNVNIPNGNLGIGLTANAAEKLEIIGNSITRGKTRGIATNYATSEGWVAAGAGAFSSQVGYFGGNFGAIGNGGSENKIEYAFGPFGAEELVWMTVPETGNNDDGGWNKALDGFANTANNGFMSVIYMRRDSGTPAGNFYHGCSGSATNNLDGTANTNPYFCAFGISVLPADVWCVSIGIIYASGDASTTSSSLGGSYRLDTGAKIHSHPGFRQKPGNSTQAQRVYHYYSTSPSAQLDFTRPGWYVVDGTEPTLNEITGGAAGTDAFWSATGDNIHNDNTGNVGIGTTSPNAKLDVNGVVTFSANTDGKNTFQFTTGAAVDDARLLMRSVDTVKVDIQANGLTYFSGGNLSIGGTSQYSGTGVRSLNIEGNYPLIAFYQIGGNLQSSIISYYNNTQFVHSSSAATFQFSNGTGDLVKILANGVVGIKIEPKTWSTDALQLGANLTMSEDVNSVYWGANAYNNSGWKRINSQSAGYMRMGTNDGIWSFSNAATGAVDSGIVWNERMRVDTNGRVGIGTTSPDASLEIVQPNSTGSSGVPALILSNDSAGQTGYTWQSWRYNESNTNYRLDLKQRVTGGIVQYSFNMVNNGVGFDDVLVLDRGKVGIGTTFPDANLEVRGTTVTSTVSDGVNSVLIGLAGSNRTTVQFDTADTTHTNRQWGLTNIAGDFYVGRHGLNVMTMKNNGNVGINISTPGEKLSVRGNIELFGEGVGDCGIRYIKYNCPDDASYNVLGIETTGLTVYGRTLLPSNGSIIFQNQNNNNQFYIRNAGGNSASFQIGYGAVGSNTSFFINGAGNIGMGNTVTTNSVKLEITGRLLVKSSSGVSDLYLGNYAANKYVRFHTNNSDTYFDMGCGLVYWRNPNSIKMTFDVGQGNMTIDGTLTQNSDIRVKENIVEIDDCIGKVQAMRGVYYNRNDVDKEITKVGVIAQEVEAVLPELILEHPKDGLKSVAYSELTAVLINAIKEQQEIIEDLKTRITKLEN